MRKRILIGAWLLGIIGGILLTSHFSAISANYSDLIEIPVRAEEIKLIKPIDIVHAEIFRDGGTISVSLKDAQGTIFSFCLDGRLQEVGLGQEPKPLAVFVNATYPNDPKGEPLPVGGRKEKIILKILQDWINDHVSAREQKELRDVSAPSAITWTETLYRARIALRFIDRLENR